MKYTPELAAKQIRAMQLTTPSDVEQAAYIAQMPTNERLRAIMQLQASHERLRLEVERLHRWQGLAGQRADEAEAKLAKVVEELDSGGSASSRVVRALAAAKGTK